MAKKEGVEELVGVLRGMAGYLFKKDQNYHVHTSLAYCMQCRSITATGENHNVYQGTDCGGDSYGIEKSANHCLNCYSGRFIEFSVLDLGELRKAYGDRTAEIIISGIENGLEEMSASVLYNENLPNLAAEWNKLPRKRKIEQVNSLLRWNSRLGAARKRKEKLEKILLGEENESLS